MVANAHTMVPTLRLLDLLREGGVVFLGAIDMHLAFAGIFRAMLVRIFEVADFAAVIVLLIVDGSFEGNRGKV